MRKAIFQVRRDATKDFVKLCQDENGLGWNVDLGSLPDTAHLPPASFDGHSLAPLCDDGKIRSVAIKKWLREGQKNDPEIRRVLDRAVASGQLPREAAEDNSAKTYVVRGENVRVEPQRDGTWIARHRGKSFVGSDRESVAVMVSRDGHLSEPDEQSKLRIARYVNGVNSATSERQAEEIFVTAIKMYIKAASGPSDEAALADIRFLPLVHDAIRYCWGVVRSDFAPGADWPSFLDRYASGRPYTVPMLDAARRAYEAAIKAGRFTGMIEQRPPEPAPTPDNLEDLDDECVAALYRGVAKTMARQSRRPWQTANPSA